MAYGMIQDDVPKRFQQLPRSLARHFFAENALDIPIGT